VKNTLSIAISGHPGIIVNMIAAVQVAVITIVATSSFAALDEIDAEGDRCGVQKPL